METKILQKIQKKLKIESPTLLILSISLHIQLNDAIKYPCHGEDIHAVLIKWKNTKVINIYSMVTQWHFMKFIASIHGIIMKIRPIFFVLEPELHANVVGPILGILHQHLQVLLAFQLFHLFRRLIGHHNVVLVEEHIKVVHVLVGGGVWVVWKVWIIIKWTQKVIEFA